MAPDEGGLKHLRRYSREARKLTILAATREAGKEGSSFQRPIIYRRRGKRGGLNSIRAGQKEPKGG